jgi:hypothetical protein
LSSGQPYPVFWTKQNKQKQQELSTQIGSKSKTANRSSKQLPITNIIISHSSTFELKKRGVLVTIHQKYFVKSILHSSWYTPLVYVFCEPFFNVVFCVCSLLVFSSQRCCQYYMNYWTHPQFNRLARIYKPVPSITPLFNLLALTTN